MLRGELESDRLPVLFQTEWCPSSRRVRQRLTELDVAYVCLQVPVERERREVLLAASGQDTIPALVTEGDRMLVGEMEITAYLNERYEEPVGATAHRQKAKKARQRELEEATR